MLFLIYFFCFFNLFSSQEKTQLETLRDTILHKSVLNRRELDSGESIKHIKTHSGFYLRQLRTMPLLLFSSGVIAVGGLIYYLKKKETSCLLKIGAVELFALSLLFYQGYSLKSDIQKFIELLEQGQLPEKDEIPKESNNNQPTTKQGQLPEKDEIPKESNNNQPKTKQEQLVEKDEMPKESNNNQPKTKQEQLVEKDEIPKESNNNQPKTKQEQITQSIMVVEAAEKVIFMIQLQDILLKKPSVRGIVGEEYFVNTIQPCQDKIKKTSLFIIISILHEFFLSRLDFDAMQLKRLLSQENIIFLKKRYFVEGAFLYRLLKEDIKKYYDLTSEEKEYFRIKDYVLNKQVCNPQDMFHSFLIQYLDIVDREEEKLFFSIFVDAEYSKQLICYINQKCLLELQTRYGSDFMPVVFHRIIQLFERLLADRERSLDHRGFFISLIDLQKNDKDPERYKEYLLFLRYYFWRDFKDYLPEDIIVPFEFKIKRYIPDDFFPSIEDKKQIIKSIRPLMNTLFADKQSR